MKNFTKIFILLISLTILGISAKAQSSIWLKALDSSGIIISYQIDTCNGQENVFLKVENKNNSKMFLSWDDHLSSGTVSFSSVGQNEYRRSLELDANQTIYSSCSNFNSDKRNLHLPLLLFLGPGSYTNVSFFISNFSITK